MDQRSNHTVLEVPGDNLREAATQIQENCDEGIDPVASVERAFDLQKTASLEGPEGFHPFNARYWIGEEIGKGGWAWFIEAGICNCNAM